MRVASAVFMVGTACMVGCADDQAGTTDATGAAPTTTPAEPEVCGVAPVPGLTTPSVEMDGQLYPTEVYEPRGREGVRVAAVIDLHGLDSNGPAEAELTRFRELADREGFVVAEPSGPVGPLGVTGWEIAAVDEPDRDDVGAIDQLIDVLIDEHCVDPARIFVAGYSNGGFLAAELACRPGSRVAAIVAVAGFHAAEPCDRPVPTLVVHGTADPIVPLGPDGTSLIVDDTTPPPLRALLASSIEEEVATSASDAGCDERPTSTALAADVTQVTYEGCGDADHQLILVEGGGHTWPGARPTADADFLGPTTASLDATGAAWAFFASVR